MKTKALVPVETIEQKILLIRGQKVMLDRDLAVLYGVATRDLNKAVNRNLTRFPNDFMVQLTRNEFEILMFHFGTSSWVRIVFDTIRELMKPPEPKHRKIGFIW